MPYPQEHSCRLRNPADFQQGTFRRVQRVSNGKRYSVIMGRLKGQRTMTEQAYRYPKDVWTVAQARKHCKDHGGQRFEPAAGQREISNGGDKMPGKIFYGKVLDVEKAKKGEPGDPIRWRLTERMVDRDGDVVEPKGGQLKEFKKDPVVLWSHNRGFEAPRPAIGIIDPKSFEQTEEYLDADVIFDVKNDEFARMIDGKVRDGFLRTGSIGFRPLTIGREPVLPGQKGVTFLKWNLLEFSIVNIPANPGANRREWEEFIEACKGFGDEYAPDPERFFKKYSQFFDDTGNDSGEGDVFEPIPVEVTEAWLDREITKLLAARGGYSVASDVKRLERYNELASLLEAFGREAPEYKTYDYEFVDLGSGRYEIRNYDRPAEEPQRTAIGDVLSDGEIKLLEENIGRALCSLSDVKMIIDGAVKGRRTSSAQVSDEILDGILADLERLRSAIGDKEPESPIEALRRQIQEI